MDDTTLLEQKKITIGPAGSPTYIGEFHLVYGDEAQLFHSYCKEHSDFGICGRISEATDSAKLHLKQAHPEIELPLDVVSVAHAELNEEFLYRLRTVAALALSRGRHGEKLPEGFIEGEVAKAVSSLAAKSKK